MTEQDKLDIVEAIDGRQRERIKDAVILTAVAVPVLAYTFYLIGKYSK